MNSKTTLIMALILLIVGIIYGLGELTKLKNEEKEYTEKRLFTIEGDKVTRVIFAKKKSMIQMEKHDNSWIMTSPEKHLVKSWDLTNLIYTITTIKKEESIKDTNLNEFGLQPPNLIITLSDGEKEETLLVGKRNYNGLSVYVKKDGSDEIFTVSSIGINDAEGKVSTFTEKRIIAGDIYDIKKLTICNNGSKTVLESPEADIWEFKEPIKKNADSKKVNLYIQSLSSVQGSDIEEGSEPNNPDKQFKSYIKLETASGKVYAIYEKEKSKKGIKCIRLPLGETITISNDAYKNFFEINTEKFEDRRILNINSETISKAEITIGNKKKIFEKTQKGWISDGKVLCEGSLKAFLWEAEILSYEENTKEKGKKEAEIILYDENDIKQAYFSIESKDKKTIIETEQGRYYIQDDKILKLTKAVIEDLEHHNH